MPRWERWAWRCGCIGAAMAWMVAWTVWEPQIAAWAVRHHLRVVR
jgi:hypothetical protein